MFDIEERYYNYEDYPSGRIGNVGRPVPFNSHQIQQRLNQAPSQASTRSIVQSSASHFNNPLPLRENQESPLLMQCSPHLKTYIQGLKQKTSMKQQIESLNLTEDEKPLFEKFTCAITFEYMTLPVMLHDRYFDFSSLANLTRLENPFNRTAFSPLEIQSARLLENELDTAIQNLKSLREEQATRSNIKQAKDNLITKTL